MFSFKFDQCNANWTDDPEMNLMFLKDIQKECTNILKKQGYLFLNEVLKQLGAPLIIKGDKYGWIYRKGVPFGDNYVDFGLYDIHRADARMFINGLTPNIVLYFNTDGDIASYLLDEEIGYRDRQELFNNPWLMDYYI